MMRPASHRDPAPRPLRLAQPRASVLVGLLWCVAVLAVMVVGLLHTATLDLRVVKNHGDQIQAYYLALAGVEKAKALLYHDAAARKRARQNHRGDLYDSPRDFRDLPFGRGQFRVFRQARAEEGGQIVYGISDEESRLNANTASAEELTQLYGLRPEVAAAIVDYRDGDNAASPNGAEAEYYVSLQPPYVPRNGPVQSVRELLLVRGITRELLLGEDANQNGLLDPEEDDGDVSDPPDNRDGVLDAGWSENLTAHSAVQNRNAAGDPRVNVQTADEQSLMTVQGITAEIARAIVAYRGQNRLESLADLLEVRAMSQAPAAPAQPSQPASGSGNAHRPPSVNRGRGPGAQQNSAPSTPSNASPSGPAAQPTGPTLISEDLLLEIADDITAADEPTQTGAINVNTASATVLACLPGIDANLAQAIVGYRQSAGFLPNVAWLLRVPGMTREIFKQVAPRLTARSETYRILSEGKVNSTGARKRIEVIVRLGVYSIDTLSYREDL